jgi:hypothetical protein
MMELEKETYVDKKLGRSRAMQRVLSAFYAPRAVELWDKLRNLFGFGRAARSYLMNSEGLNQRYNFKLRYNK